MKTKLVHLLEVRKIIAILTVLLFIYLSVVGYLQTDFIQNVILTVIAFYFAKNSEKESEKQ